MERGRLPVNALQNPYILSMNSGSPSGQTLPYNYHNNYVQSPSVNRKQLPNINRADGPSQTINLNDNVSFARNFKSRLFNADPQEQLTKQLVQDKYRDELRIQMEDDLRRKAAKKAKEDEEDARWEQKFYDNIRIQAQQRSNKKEEPNYFMMRTAKGHRKDNKQSKFSPDNHLSRSLIQESKTEQIIKKDNLKRTIYDSPKIIKRGGYHNQSSLDQTRESNDLKHNPQTHLDQDYELNRSRDKPIQKAIVEVSKSEDFLAEQDRISQLLIFQQNMLRKLDYFKRQIYRTNQALNLNDEFLKIKTQLRSKPLNMQKVYSLSPTDGLDDLLNNSEMYQLPIINKNRKIYEGERQAKHKPSQMLKSEDIEDQDNKAQKRQVIHLIDKSRSTSPHPNNQLEQRNMNPTKFNDKNILEQQVEPEKGLISNFGIQADD